MDTNTNKPHWLIDLLAIGRVANLPSVITNLCVGLTIALPFSANGDNLWNIFNYRIFLSGILLYLGGCFFNDWADQRWDAEHKPHRPLVAKRIKPAPILISALLFLAIPHLLIIEAGFRVHLTLIFITLSIGIYTAIHKKTAFGVIPMGLCRALLYPLGFLYAVNLPLSSSNENHSTWLISTTTISSSTYTVEAGELMALIFFIVPLMIGLLCYIAGLSLLARSESKNYVSRSNRIAAYLLLFSIVISHLFFPILHHPLSLLLGLPLIIAILVAVKKIRHSVSSGVSILLSSICLADLTVLVGIYWISENYGSQIGPFSILIVACCYPLALLLQKIAPAT